MMTDEQSAAGDKNHLQPSFFAQRRPPLFHLASIQRMSRVFLRHDSAVFGPAAFSVSFSDGCSPRQTDFTTQPSRAVSHRQYFRKHLGVSAGNMTGLHPFEDEFLRQRHAIGNRVIATAADLPCRMSVFYRIRFDADQQQNEGVCRRRAAESELAAFRNWVRLFSLKHSLLGVTAKRL